ncbi:hypothetical protein [Hymenobacter cheonanensis]|uniref:hypothetical protein n=1 Tax=Hymenobacter sp. CA2-7 TaxID=3063993 RepID=UPI00271252D8|nr:hypothetical protein [Hymenobacter sp. CA2-7]MDO7886679.1 hypothetical protein [Hymenobacter sp. CA2-7]
MKKLLIAAVALGLLAYFFLGTYSSFQRIDSDFQFGYYDRPDNTNVYCGTLQIIPGGCDEAKWDGDIIVARGLRANHPYAWSDQSRAVKGQTLYFIIHKAAYLPNPAAQELSDGFEGPLSQAEFEARDPIPHESFKNSR